MIKKYIIRYNDKKCVELSKPINTTLVYRIPYKNIKNKNHNIEISNRFIVYILIGKKIKGLDYIYLGKSKNGIDNRPTAHESKNIDWKLCYIFTDIKERTILNDGTIQYLEDKICNRINEIGKYENLTKQTTSGTANHSDMEDCNTFLEEAYDMLNTLGLDLFIDDDVCFEKVKNNKIFECPENLKDLYDRLEKLIYSVEPKIQKVQMAVYNKYMIDNKIILTVSSVASSLKICFNIPQGKLVDTNNLLEDVSNIGKHGIGNYRLSLKNDKCFDDVRDFINQVLQYYKFTD